jgi:Na+/melibiose symporter-like transporter
MIGRFFGLFRAVSLIAAIVFNFWLIGIAETHSLEIFVGLGLLFGVGFTVMCLKVKEGEYPSPPPPESNLSFAQRYISPIRNYLKECYTNPFYLWIFLAMMLGGLAAGPVNTFSVFYAKSLGMDMTFYGRLLVITYCFSLVLSYFLGWLADKFHPLRVGIVAMAFYAVIMMWAGFYRLCRSWNPHRLIRHRNGLHRSKAFSYSQIRPICLGGWNYGRLGVHDYAAATRRILGSDRARLSSHLYAERGSRPIKPCQHRDHLS